MSTPRTDAAQHHQYDTEPPQPLGLVDVDFARKLERELNAANDRIAALQTYVERLEEAGFLLRCTSANQYAIDQWHKAKVFKP